VILSIDYQLLPETLKGVGVGLTGSGSGKGVAVPVALGDGLGLGLTMGVGLSLGEKSTAATFVGRDDISSHAKIINAINTANTIRVMHVLLSACALPDVALTYNKMFVSHSYRPQLQLFPAQKS
jgi:hypothetical protein